MMTYTITSQCIACDRCFSVCPTNAVQRNGHQYWIDPTLCNDCSNSYSVAQCWATCPTPQGCIPAPSKAAEPNYLQPLPKQPPIDYWDSWFNTYTHVVNRLRGSQQSEYWQWWFETYSKVLSAQMQSQIQPALIEKTAHS